MLVRLYNADDVTVGKLSLIDLAGSERGADNENTDSTTRMEGRQINTSLLALKEVIRAKELGRAHAPYRQSRLTQVLEESLTGARCQTVVIACISPSEKDVQQTINTLRYAEGLRPAGKKSKAKSSVNTGIVVATAAGKFKAKAQQKMPVKDVVPKATHVTRATSAPERSPQPAPRPRLSMAHEGSIKMLEEDLRRASSFSTLLEDNDLCVSLLVFAGSLIVSLVCSLWPFSVCNLQGTRRVNATSPRSL